MLRFSVKIRIVTAILLGFTGAVALGRFFYLNHKADRQIGVGVPVAAEAQGTATILGDGYLKYTHREPAFSIEYPKELDATSFQETDGAETIVFQRRSDRLDAPPEQKMGFQIFIAPFDAQEGAVITKERVLRDIPDLNMEETSDVILGGGTRALIFLSEDTKLGKTREVWFAGADGHLFEVTAYAHLDAWLAKILSSWRFGE